ncbi:MAG: response regulator [Syntrophaceae bacterium]
MPAKQERRSNTILIVEDDQGLAELIADALRTIGNICEIALTGAQALSWLGANHADLILLDYSLPDMKGNAFVDAMQGLAGAGPFLVITGQGDERIAVEMMKAGAHDYLPKDITLLERLPVAVKRALEDIATSRLLEETKGMLKESERLLSDIITFLPDATLVIDLKGRVIAWNRAMEEMTGVPAGNILGRGDYEYALPFYGERRPMLVDLVLKPRDTLGKAYQTITWRGDILIAETTVPVLKERPVHLWGMARALRDARGNPLGAIEAIRDITARKTAEDEILRLNAFYMNILNGIVNGVWVSDRDYVITYANRGMAAILDMPEQDLLGMNLLQNLPLETMQVFMPLLAEAQATMKPVAFDSVPLLTNTRRQTFQSGWLIPLVKDGCFVGMICTTDDITARKQAEDERELLQTQLLQAQKMESIGRLAGGVAHDFNNMLLPIIGYSDMILTDLAQDHPLYREIKNIQQAALKAKDLTRQLLAFSRKQPLEVKVLDLNKVILDFQKMLRRTIRENIEIHIELGNGLTSIKADLSQLEQVIMNLAVNAQDAIPEAGSITISTSEIELSEDATPSGLEAGDYVRLSFSDSGCGMAPETLAQIFEPFFTTKESGRGTGLGLSMVYGIVKQHGGSITVESTVGQGTLFTILLPRVDETPRAADTPFAADHGRIGTETILVVEDDQVVRDLVRQMLKRSGYTVLVAEHAGAALEISRRYTGEIQLLLTDVVMPAMHGRQLFEALLAERTGLKAVYMSGYTHDDIARHGVDIPGTFFIQKPFTLQAITEKIRAALDA